MEIKVRDISQIKCLPCLLHSSHWDSLRPCITQLDQCPLPFPTLALGAEKGEAEVSPKKAWTAKDGALGISGCLGFCQCNPTCFLMASRSWSCTMCSRRWIRASLVLRGSEKSVKKLSWGSKMLSVFTSSTYLCGAMVLAQHRLSHSSGTCKCD